MKKIIKGAVWWVVLRSTGFAIDWFFGTVIELARDDWEEEQAVT